MPRFSSFTSLLFTVKGATTAWIYTSAILSVIYTNAVTRGVSGADLRGSTGEPPEKVINPGQSLSIPCYLETAGGSVQWMRNGHPVVLDVGAGAGGRRQWNISRDGTAALTITQVTRADDGLWECREFGDDDSVRRVTKVLKLVVTGAPEEPFLTLGGEKLRNGSRVSVQEREEVEVGCVARRAVPAVRHIHWRLGETNLTAASNLLVEFSPQEDSYTSRSVLVLNASRDLHGLELSCHIYHMSWSTFVAVSASVDVLYVPSFSISREPGFGFPILEKMPVSLHCTVDANPPCEPKWLKDDAPPPVPQSPDGYLNFSSIERHHAGWYRCAAVHELGTFASFGYFLNVRHGPEIVDQPPSQVKADFGEPVQLDCKADGTPLPSYCWTRVRSGRLESIAAEGSLVLDPVLYSDAGSYQCTATNHLGWKEERAMTRDVLLSISGRPDVKALNKSLLATVGKPVRLSVMVCANPPPTRAYWIVGRTLLSPGEMTPFHYVAHNYTGADTPFCRTTSLDIRPVHSEDAGEILFVARNSKGVDDAAIILNVTHPASFSFSQDHSSVGRVEVKWMFGTITCIGWTYICIFQRTGS